MAVVLVTRGEEKGFIAPGAVTSENYDVEVESQVVEEGPIVGRFSSPLLCFCKDLFPTSISAVCFPVCLSARVAGRIGYWPFGKRTRGVCCRWAILIITLGLIAFASSVVNTVVTFNRYNEYMAQQEPMDDVQSEPAEDVDFVYMNNIVDVPPSSPRENVFDAPHRGPRDGPMCKKTVEKLCGKCEKDIECWKKCKAENEDAIKKACGGRHHGGRHGPHDTPHHGSNGEIHELYMPGHIESMDESMHAEKSAEANYEDAVADEEDDHDEDVDVQDGAARFQRLNRVFGVPILNSIHGLTALSMLCLAVALRNAFRSKFSIPPALITCCGGFGGLIEDCLVTYFCHCCSLAQQARHLWPGSRTCDILSSPEPLPEPSRAHETEADVIEATVVVV